MKQSSKFYMEFVEGYYMQKKKKKLCQMTSSFSFLCSLIFSEVLNTSLFHFYLLLGYHLPKSGYI